MNSALQCLSNTPGLMKYFCKFTLFKDDLNNENPLASKHNMISLEFAKFLNRMWNSPKKGWGDEVFSPAKLKQAIGNENSMFKGF